MKNQISLKKAFWMVLEVISIAVLAIILKPAVANADDGMIMVDGIRYEFNKDSKYVPGKANASSEIFETTNTYGRLSVSGNISTIDSINGIPVYGVCDEEIHLTYAYTDRLLNASNEAWHLVSDTGKSVDGQSIDNRIEMGAIIIRTSKDGIKWVDTYAETNVFENVPNRTESFYETTDIQLKNGCYYKVYVVYELGKKVGFKTVYKRYAEVYTFYAYDINEAIKLDETSEDLKYCFSEKINTGLDNGYSEYKEIDKKDPHFGWNLGEFFIKGYTRQTKENDGTIVFLENTGDDVVLYFDLLQDIDALNGNDNLSISSDKKGYDKYFEIPQTYMGRGTLIVRYTDYENKVHDPVIYEDFLSACLSPGADTQIQLYGEGDYEVSLDYEIKNDPRKYFGISVFPTYTNYKIFFNFSIRNGKCQVYPMDIVTGSELTSSSYTENGFRLDLAYSRYLDLSAKREILGSDGALKEDQVFENLAKNGSTFTEEGLYTITAKNKYTDQTVSKVIYVGSNNVLKAVARTGMSLSEITELVDRGALIDQYGNIDLSPMDMVTEITVVNNDLAKPSDIEEGNTGSGMNSYGLLFAFFTLVIIVQILLIIIAVIVTSRRRHTA